MNDVHFTLKRLDADVDRAKFDCGSEPISRYFKQQANQDMRRRVSVCYVALDSQTGIVAGFYTLSASSVSLIDLPTEIQKKLPRYPAVPVIKLGRLAVDKKYTGQGIGGALLGNALERIVNNDEIGACALVVEAKDSQAATFYTHHGFLRLPDDPLILFFPLEKISLSRS